MTAGLTVLAPAEPISRRTATTTSVSIAAIGTRLTAEATLGSSGQSLGHTTSNASQASPIQISARPRTAFSAPSRVRSHSGVITA